MINGASINYKRNYMLKPNISFMSKKNNIALIDKTVDYISSDKFYKSKIQNKNWQDANYANKLETIYKDKVFLKKRSEKLQKQIIEQLKKTYKGKDTIIIPWSGGRDSSVLLAMSLLACPNKKFELVTVINGMGNKLNGPEKQLKRVLSSLNKSINDSNINLIYIDKTDDIEKYAINTALKDRNLINAPTICSSCKNVIEKSIEQYAKKIGVDTVVMGYSKYQGLQNWIEQIPEHQEYMQQNHSKEGINFESPLYELLEYPFDPILILASIGISIKDQKSELDCQAGGLNPKDINNRDLIKFLQSKNKLINSMKLNSNEIYESIPHGKIEDMQRLIATINSLKVDPEFTKGRFNER